MSTLNELLGAETCGKVADLLRRLALGAQIRREHAASHFYDDVARLFEARK